MVHATEQPVPPVKTDLSLQNETQSRRVVCCEVVGVVSRICKHTAQAELHRIEKKPRFISSLPHHCCINNFLHVFFSSIVHSAEMSLGHKGLPQAELFHYLDAYAAEIEGNFDEASQGFGEWEGRWLLFMGSFHQSIFCHKC